MFKQFGKLFYKLGMRFKQKPGFTPLNNFKFNKFKIKFWPVRLKTYLTGLTLMELVVAISLFAILTLIATKTFTRMTEVQNRTKDIQNIEGDLRYAMGVFADEVKNARLHQAGGDLGCGGVTCDNNYFCVVSNQLFLRDKNNQCVEYTLSGTALSITRGVNTYTITSNDVSISSLNFLASATGDRVVIQMKASGSTDYNKTINYQTAITNTTLR